MICCNILKIIFQMKRCTHWCINWYVQWFFNYVYQDVIRTNHLEIKLVNYMHSKILLWSITFSTFSLFFMLICSNPLVLDNEQLTEIKSCRILLQLSSDHPGYPRDLIVISTSSYFPMHMPRLLYSSDIPLTSFILLRSS